MTDLLTQAELQQMTPELRAIYAKMQQIRVLETAKLNLAMRYVPDQPGSADIEDAINELQLELAPLEAQFQEMCKANAVITPVTVDQVEELKGAITSLSALVAASAAAGELIASAQVVISKLA